MKNLILTVFVFSNLIFSQENTIDTILVNKQNLDEVVVTAIRASSNTPVPFKLLDANDISRVNLGQDIPVILSMTPSVNITSDAGNGIGYTGMSIRGSDGFRINVTINGVPLNDSESHATYWVDLPDFASSISSIQIQRGVGTSTNGAGAFGGSINVSTQKQSQAPKFKLSNSFGSYGTLKNSISFTTGSVGKYFELSGNLSKIYSDGYIDRASSNLKGYFLQGSYDYDKTNIKLIAFGGHERTYQAWYGLDRETLNTNRRFNYAGMYYNADGEEMFYDKQEDNYKQDHYQLIFNYQMNSSWKANLTLHYTHGRGYYEEYSEDQNLSDYLINENSGQAISDLIRRKWLDNDFYGSLFNFIYDKYSIKLILGGTLNKYYGDHYGEVIWARNAGNSEIRHRYYDNFGNKEEFNLFSKLEFTFSDKLYAFLDLQNRNINYNAVLIGGDNINKSFNFFNPKAGIYYKLNTSNEFYFSFARAHREPTRTDYENGNPYPEMLDDFELGWKYKGKKSIYNINLYLMNYNDQLVLTGERDDVGYYIRANVGESYRAGVEFDGVFYIDDYFTIKPNITFSSNKNNDYLTQFDGSLKNFGKTDISFSPNLIFGNSFEFNIDDKTLLFFNTKYVGKQYMSNTNVDSSVLASYLVNDLGLNHSFSIPGFSDDSKLKILINNLFNQKYESYGGHYFYDIDNKTYSGAYFYPMAEINFLIGLDFNF